MYTENYDHESNKINLDQILDNIDLDTWDEDDLFDVTIGEDEEWDLNNEEI